MRCIVSAIIELAISLALSTGDVIDLERHGSVGIASNLHANTLQASLYASSCTSQGIPTPTFALVVTHIRYVG